MCLDDKQLHSGEPILFPQQPLQADVTRDTSAHPEAALAQHVISYGREYCSEPDEQPRKTGQYRLLLQIGTNPSGSTFLLTLIALVCSALASHKTLTLNACRTSLCRWFMGDPICLKGRVWRTRKPPENRSVVHPSPPHPPILVLQGPEEQW